MLHIALHFLVPGLVVALLMQNKRLNGPFPKKWLPENWPLAYFILIATMLVDIDHLLANPIYDPGRCSIGFHPLHQLWFIALYIVLCFIPVTRLVGLGLTIHMALDSIDCQVTNGIWIN
jgi:hypothetical protein